MKKSDLNHLRRLLAWMRCEVVGQSPDEVAATVRDIGAKLGPAEISEAGMARMVKAHDDARAVPQYVRAAIKALEKTLAPGEVVELGADALDALDTQAAEIARLTAELEAVRPGAPVKSEAVPNEPGWACEHPRYGKWFISRAAVIEDWKRDQREAYPDKPECEPSDEDVRIWFSENTSWIEVNFLGRQLAQPDMEPFKKSWLEEMKKNMNYLEGAIEVKASA